MKQSSRNSPWRPWVTLFATAFALRLVAVQVLWAPGDEPRSYEHGEIAANLVEGAGFRVTFLGTERLTSQQAPFYPYFLAGAFRIFGTHTATAEWAVQTVQCVAGACLCLAVVRLARAVLPENPAIAWYAGWGAALYPPHVYMVTHLQVALWAALWLTLLTAWTLSADPARAGRTGAVAGLLGGILLLTEPILAVALPILAIALWQRTWNDASGNKKLFAAAQPTFLMTMATCLVIAPWIVRNYLVHGELVFIKSTFGYAFWQGNNAASFGTDKIPMPDDDRLLFQRGWTPKEMNRALWAARYETMYIDDMLLTDEDRSYFAGCTEPECCRHLGERAWEYIHEHPERYGHLCLNRLRFFLFIDETNPKASHPIYLWSTLAWLSLASLGLIVTRSSWRTLWPTYALFAAVLAFHALTITSARFRIPVEPLTFPWCAGGLAWLASATWRGCGASAIVVPPTPHGSQDIGDSRPR